MDTINKLNKESYQLNKKQYISSEISYKDKYEAQLEENMKLTIKLNKATHLEKEKESELKLLLEK